MSASEEPLYLTAGRCSMCGSSAIQALRCQECPLAQLDYIRERSAAGRLLERALDLRFDLDIGVQVPDITAEEDLALKVMKQESAKWEKEMSDKDRREREAEQRVAAMRARGQMRGPVR